MKKTVLNPLALDKETIAKLDEKQLQEIVGGVNVELAATSTGCGSGSSTCAVEEA
ncbi:bacteriocin [Chitinophaga oryziterrae]|uniref:Bacteriocin n=1 Tax=Chitinophaga oryziterrae TaxID=1031224 RepID=A0A6N8JGL4_9BACT|nr:class I lanthipeptide [Chitinophaga oryziterrae]MVT44367.1 bacteriocin [Chitinophaga oryziterrae]